MAATSPSRGWSPSSRTTPSPEPERRYSHEFPAIRVTGTWWRVNHAGGDPLHWSDEPADGRWQRGEVVRALYLADSAETAWAEWYRHSAELGVPPQNRMPRDLWRFEVDVDERRGSHCARPSRRRAASRRSLPAAVSGRVLSQSARSAGAPVISAVFAPSAAHVGGQCPCRFQSRAGRALPESRPIKPAKRVKELPALPTGLRT